MPTLDHPARGRAARITLLTTSIFVAIACDRLTSEQDASGCSKDADCKGSRVCTDGACVDPTAAVPAAAAVASPAAAPPDPETTPVAAGPSPVGEAAPAPTPTPTPAPAPAPVANEASPSAAKPAGGKPGKTSYAANVQGVCEKFVDCGCESSVAACKQTVGGQSYAKAALQCVVRLECASMCGTGPAECVKAVSDAEIAASKQAFELGRSVRDHWPTGDGGSCPAGYRRSGDYCYPN
jgi:hypothetical protein